MSVLNSNFKTFEQFKNNFQFLPFVEIRVLNCVQELTSSQGIILLAQQSLKHITEANRPKSHKDFYMEIQYVNYINCLLNLDIREYFDKIFDVLFKYGWKIESLETVKGELQV